MPAEEELGVAEGRAGDEEAKLHVLKGTCGVT